MRRTEVGSWNTAWFSFVRLVCLAQKSNWKILGPETDVGPNDEKAVAVWVYEAEVENTSEDEMFQDVLLMQEPGWVDQFVH